MSTATDMLARYLAAEAALLDGKEVRFGDRTLKSEDLIEIRRGRQEWEARVAAENARSRNTPTVGGLRYSVARFGP